jgi:hypothetical protein
MHCELKQDVTYRREPKGRRLKQIQVNCNDVSLAHNSRQVTYLAGKKAVDVSYCQFQSNFILNITK